MADEFIKGLAILIGAGLGWMVIAGWYRTPSFEGAQLVGPRPAPESLSLLDQLALLTGDALGVFAVAGALTFWVVIPAYRELRASGS